MTTSARLVRLDDTHESQEFTSPRYEAPVFFRQSEPDGPIYLAYAADGTPTSGNQYETFATLEDAEEFARRHQFVAATTQIATVTVPEDVRAAGTILYAGTYRVEMPADYDPSLVTGEDILLDDAIRVVE